MNAKKLIALLLACLMLLSMAACAGKTETANTPATDKPASDTPAPAAEADAPNTNTSDKNLTIVMPSEPSCIWGAPVGKNENEALTILGAITDRLVEMDNDTGEVKPSLATSWEWLDGTHVQMKLREDVTMTDGTPLVADDVAYTVGVWAEYSPANDTGRFVVGAVADDEHTVTIEFNREAPDLLAMLSWACFGIVSEDEVNAAGGLEAAANNPVVGSGKYRFVEWKNGQYVTLERNENYWNKDYTGYFKTLTFNFTADAAARVMAVESGDADVAYNIPVNQAITYEGRDDLTTLVYTYGQISHVWYNMGENAGATKDLKVRQAIDLAMDFDAITLVASGGKVQPALGYFETNSKYYNETYTAEERAVNVEKAKELLAEAGYPDGLELRCTCLANLVNIWTVIQGNLAQAGITLNIETPDTPQFVQEAFGGDYDLILVGEYVAARYPTLFCFLREENISGGGLVIGGPKWTTPELDAKIAAFIEEKDEATAKQMAGEIEQFMKENCVVSNLCPETSSTIVAAGLKGFSCYDRGMIDVTNFYYG